ncbi:MAG: FtsQ-type POTRA domain-containing protein [Alphaproteobacteria bacterium]|nr:FtsQ-type POTRA domain-containing protein [Alphaproteobacteria bacterium]
MVLLFHKRLVSDDAYRMTYPEVIFVNKVSIDRDLAVSSLRDLIVPFLEQDKIFEVDIDAMASGIKELPWIENVSVARDYPNVLKIFIKSKNIVAYKSFNGEYYPISENGELLDIPVDYESGILVFGDLAEERVMPLLNFLNGYPDILKKVSGLQFINGLRWNLLLYDLGENGITVKLDNSYEDGIVKLAELDLLQGILSKDISELDLRDLDKILVKQRGNYGG